MSEKPPEYNAKCASDAALYLRACARAHEPGVLLLGNMPALDIVALCDMFFTIAAASEKQAATLARVRAIAYSSAGIVAEAVRAALGPKSTEELPEHWKEFYRNTGTPLPGDRARMLEIQVGRTEMEMRLRQAEHEAANAELRRRIINQASGMELPRAQDVAEVHALKARVAELEGIIRANYAGFAADCYGGKAELAPPAPPGGKLPP